MRIRFAKVRRTDYRPMSRREAAEAAEHDKMVALFDVETLRGMESDLGKRRLKFAGSPENKWAAARLEAIRRRLEQENKNQ